MARADCLIVLPEDVRAVAAGTPVDVWLLVGHRCGSAPRRYRPRATAGRWSDPLPARPDRGGRRPRYAMGEGTALRRRGDTKGPGPPSPETATPAVEPLVRSPATGGRSFVSRAGYPPRTESIPEQSIDRPGHRERKPAMCTVRPNDSTVRRSGR
ncbi:MAG TPA: hypothetical protein VM367_02230 [Pseudonocardia sp.]|nr:hypothetical protein [Pseudonocardia sp.]